jgi:hypothetical protein
MFALDKSTVRIPARSTAVVHVVADTRVQGLDGAYGGIVTATGPGTRLRTPVGLTREEESYDLTVHAVDRLGQPAQEFYC